MSVLDDVPRGKALLLTASGGREVVDGPFDDVDKINGHLNCQYFQMVPAMMGDLKGKALLLMDEEGAMNSSQNTVASELLGEQVIGGKLYGNIMVLHPDDLE